ncbi:hypothetical protein [Sphingobacterium mizutaii]|uniref:hypothetical protein n=1 Tax=Sphingobacterium mizutaii TaxID=1010 RepID=UPI003D975921
MLTEDHPIKRDDLLKDIPDNKAFNSCVGACAKSHLKWAEALRIRVVFGIRELLRRFWLLLGFKSNEESKFCFFLNLMTLPARGFPINDRIFHKDVNPSGGSEN